MRHLSKVFIGMLYATAFCSKWQKRYCFIIQFNSSYPYHRYSDVARLSYKKLRLSDHVRPLPESCSAIRAWSFFYVLFYRYNKYESTDNQKIVSQMNHPIECNNEALAGKLSFVLYVLIGWKGPKWAVSYYYDLIKIAFFNILFSLKPLAYGFFMPK